MFSSKNSVTREEVQDMINKSNQSMCQWITLLEQKNAQLEQKNVQLEYRNGQLEQQNKQLHYNLVNLQNKLEETYKKLENRITDFTDHWHPIIMQNINRIKDELVETVRNEQTKTNNKDEIDYETKYKKLEDKLQSLEGKFNDTGLEDHVVVGYNMLNPIIINKKLIDKYVTTKIDFYSLSKYFKLYIETDRGYKHLGKPLLRALNLVKDKCSNFDINQQLLNQNCLTFYDDNFNEIFICQRDINDKCIEIQVNGPKASIESIKKLLSLIDPDKLLLHGQETYNGMPVRKYIESFF